MAMRADIAAQQRARGRPKGTGIDDRDYVVRLQSMLAADSALKPTTAIKQLGVTDPSVIRRLRDKLAEPVLAKPVITEPNLTAPVAPAKALIKSTPIKTEAPKSTRAAQTKIAREKKEPASSRAISVQITPPSEPSPTAQPQPTITLAEQKARETALLAAYLQAMQQSQPSPNPNTTAEAKPEPKAIPRPEPPKPEPTKPQQSAFPFAHMMPQMPGFPGMPNFPGMPPMGMPGMPNPMQAFSIPGMPSFLQPFQQKQTAPQPGTDQARQLEALKLAIEATTAIARFQLHLVENAAAYSPMAMMLQGQSFIGQMMIAGLTGQLGALHRQMTNPATGEKK